MEETTFGDKLKKTAEDVAQRVGEIALQTSEKIGEMRETQKLTARIQELQKERDKCRLTMADLVIRMLDQGAFMDSLLRPEYQRIKDIDIEVARLEKEREQVGQHCGEECAATENDSSGKE